MKSTSKYFVRFVGCFAVVLMELLSLDAVQAQDIHFSQYYNSPLAVNPAMTGVFDGIVRVTNNYRSQWSSLGEGYKTLQLSVDAPLGKNPQEKSYFGGGLLLYQDKAGSAQLKRTMAEASLSYTTALDDASEHWFSVGFQAGLDQFAVDLSQATWDEQWNGDHYDPSIPTTEIIQLPTFSHLDINAGVNYYYSPDGFNTVSAGLSMSHIGSPNVSFIPLGEDPLQSRFTINSSGDFAANDDRSLFINPRLLVQMQGKQKEVILGGYVRNKLRLKSLYTGYEKEIFFDLGAFYRMNESFILSSRFQYHAFGLGISYDFGVGKLAKLVNANSWEMSLNYILPVPRGQRARNFNKMPRFL